MRWIGTAPRKPEKVFVVHGQPEAAEHLAGRIAKDFGSQVQVPDHGEGFEM